MDKNGSNAKKMAERYKLSLYEVEKALGKGFDSPDISDAFTKYNLSIGKGEETLHWAKELKRWIKLELAKAKTPTQFRFVFFRTPETFSEIRTVIALWDQTSRREIFLKRASPLSAKEAHRILQDTRPTSDVYFLAEEVFNEALDRDFRTARDTGDISLLFDISKISFGYYRTEIERLLVRLCKTESDLEELLKLITDKDRRIELMMNLAKFNGWL